MDAQHAGEALVGALVVAKQALDFFGGRRRDVSLDRRLEQKFNDFKLELAELRAFIIGPDGQNGIRGDLRSLTDDVRAIEERERDRDRRVTYERQRPAI